MEFWLLTKIGVAVDLVVKVGYAIVGGYVLKTGVRYYQDYKISVEQEKAEVK